MKILILYGTTEGQTRKIAGFTAARFRDAGDSVTLIDATQDTTAVNLRDYDATIIAGSLHVGRYQSSVVHFARANHATLNAMPSAFISVSLAAAGTDPEDVQGIATCADHFKSETSWTTADIQHVAGAFRFAEYDYFKRLAMRLIAWRKGVHVEAGKDLELTDWEALAASVDSLRDRFAHSAERGHRS